MESLKKNINGQWTLVYEPLTKAFDVPPPLPKMPPPLPKQGEKTKIIAPEEVKTNKEILAPEEGMAIAGSPTNRILAGARALADIHPHLRDNTLNHDWDAFYAGDGNYSHNPHDAIHFETPEEANATLASEYQTHGHEKMIPPDYHQMFNFDPEEQGALPDDPNKKLKKSNYGPKGSGLYSPTDNAKRKAKNIGSVEGVGPNQAVKPYAPTGMSAKEQASSEANKYKKLSRKNPVKRLTPEELKTYKKSEVEFAKNGQWSLTKGESGDWKKEGYSIKHTKADEGSLPGFKVTAHDKSGTQVGQTHVVNHPNKKHIWVDGVHVHDDHQRKGLATAMYHHAESVAGKPLKASKERTPSSKALWSQSNRKFGGAK